MTWTSSWSREAASSHAQLDQAGYAFDYISDDQIAKTRTAGGGAGHVPATPTTSSSCPRPIGCRWPRSESLRELARGGATIVFDGLPSDVPGFGNLAQRRSGVPGRARRMEVFGRSRRRGGTCRVRQWEMLRGDVLAALKSIGTAREAFADTPIDFIRRRTASGYDYFLANLTGEAFAGWVTLGVTAAGATMTDPLTGRSGAAVLRASRRYASAHLSPVEARRVAARVDVDPRCSAGPQWTWLEPAGAPVPIDRDLEHRVHQGRTGIAARNHHEGLKSWTELGGEAAQRFAGTARYRIEFDAPARAPTPGC